MRFAWFASLTFAVLSHAADFYLYEQRSAAVASWVEVACDGQPSASVKGGYIFALQLGEGRHTLSVRDGVPVTLEVEASEPAFVRLDWNMSVARAPIPVLSKVPRARAQHDVQFLTCVPKNKIRSSQVMRDDPRQAEQKHLKHRGQD